MKHKYRVTGNHEGVEIDEEVEAHTQNSAKAIAGISNGFGGKRINAFIRDRSIKVRKIK